MVYFLMNPSTWWLGQAGGGRQADPTAVEPTVSQSVSVAVFVVIAIESLSVWNCLVLQKITFIFTIYEIWIHCLTEVM